MMIYLIMTCILVAGAFFAGMLVGYDEGRRDADTQIAQMARRHRENSQ